MKKLYYSIGEVNKITGLKPHVLRYWETNFPQLKPAKNRSGKRIYTENDIKIILELKGLIRNRGFSTSGAKKLLSQEKSSVNSIKVPPEVQRDLKEMKLFLQEMLEHL
jgi:DNA-binding transcriptional MerR regulator